jgi:hypothetical protein
MKKVETTIGGHVYRMELLGALTGQGVALTLYKPMGALFSSAAKQGLAKLNLEAVASAAGEALSHLSQEDLRFLSATFAEKCVVLVHDKGNTPHPLPLSPIFDEHFAGRYPELLSWLRWGIEVNRFFGSLLEKLSSLEELAPSPSDSPEASNGGPGDSSFRTG